MIIDEIESLKVIYKDHRIGIYKLDHPGEEGQALKVLIDDYPAANQVRKFYNEYNILEGVNIDGVRQVLSKEEIRGRPSLILEYIEGITLKAVIIQNAISLKNKLLIAVKLADILADVHKNRIIHKDINPNNILVDPTSFSIKLIDFDIATKIDLKQQHLGNPEQIDGTLQYMSPEQTGRMNRIIDYRSDLYSYGITLYELFTGKLPFSYSDPIEIVYGHLTKTPELPSKINSSIPEILSDIILKLLNKDAENRYQSAMGVSYDLKRCLQQLDQYSEIVVFPLATHDHSGIFKIPSRLYGREKERNTLLHCYQRISNGEKLLLLIAGYSGVGKSSLIYEVHSPLTERRGFFIEGKFDQYQRDIPYYAWIQAFNQFVDLLLTENPLTLEKWKNVILRALDGRGRVLVDVVPKLEKIIGSQKEVPELDQHRNKIRFQEVVKSFIFTIAKSEHPLFIFIDDWQWADPASIDLLHLLMSEERFQYLIITGAYRNNEVSEEHLLKVLIRKFENQNIPVFHIVLENLHAEHVNQLINDTFSCSPDKFQELSNLIYNKTRGNPFFVRQMLQSIYENGAISYEQDDSSNFRWTWDIQMIQKLKVTDNVVDLLIIKVKGLPEKTQEILQSASCIGPLFEIKLLSVISEMPEDKILLELETALLEGILVPNGIDVYSFAHDKIQQAVYSLIQDSKKQAVHYRAGRLMLNELRTGKDLQSIPQEHIFDVVNQLISGKEFIRDDTDKVELAELCLQAGKKAQASNAHKAAELFIQNGIDQLSFAGWKIHYSLMLSLKLALSDSKKSQQYFKEAEEILDEALLNAHTKIDKLHILRRKGLLYQWLNRFDLVYSTLLQAFQLRGIEVPENEENLSMLVEKEWEKVKKLLSKISIPSLIDTSPMTNELQLVNMSLMPIYINYCLTQNKMLHFQYFILKAVSTFLRYGHSKETANVYSTFCAVLASRNHLQMSFQFAKLTIEMIKKDPMVTWNAFTLTRAALWGMPYGAHLREAIPIYEWGYELALSAGESYYVWNVRLDIFFHRLAMGNSLQDMLEESNNIIKGGVDSEVIMWQDLGYIELQLIKYLMDIEEENSLYTSESKSDILVHPNNLFTLGFYYHNQLQFYCWFPEPKVPLDFIERARRFHKALMTNIKWADFDFYASIFITQRFYEVVLEKKNLYWETIEQSLENLRLRAEACPDNFAHKYYLVSAEILRIENNFLEAQNFYTKSVTEAEKYGFTHVQALAEELFADFYIEKGLKYSATGHLLEARKLYHKWGAFAKVKQLETRHTEYFDLPIERLEKTNVTTTLHEFDLMSIIKASHTLSSEIVPSNLLEKTLQILLEDTGAQRCAIIEYVENKPVLRANTSSNNKFEFFENEGIETRLDLPLSVINFVSRNLEPNIIPDIKLIPKFKNDPYFLHNNIKSILCYPVVRNAKLMAIFYFENNLVTGAFTDERIEFLNTLSTQVGISLENARLYESLDKAYQQQLQFTAAIRRFVPIDYLNQLGHDSITDVKLGEQVQGEMTVMFADIRSYTTLSESMSPKENFNFINAYLKRIGPAIKNNNGFVAQYYGDGFMAVFKQTPQDAVEAAMEIQQVIYDYNANRILKGRSAIEVGIGIHTGKLMMGIIGDSERMSPNIISDTVNTASRLEGLTKYFKARIIISEITKSLLKSLPSDHCRFLGKVMVKGKKEVLSIFEVFNPNQDDDSNKKAKTKEAFERCLFFYFDKDFINATLHLKKVSEQFPEDINIQHYLRKSANYLVEGVPENWTGVEAIESK